MSGDEVTVRYWARAFTREIDIAVSMAGFAELSSLVGNGSTLSPVQVAEVTPAGVVPCVALADTNGWLVRVTSESVDVQHTPVGPNSSPTFASFCERAGEELSRVLLGKAAKAHRVAVIWERLLPQMEEYELNAIAVRMLRLPPLFGTEPFEWDWRAAARIDRTFGSTSETTNTLATLKRVQVAIQGAKTERLLLITDVNTDQRNISTRLTGEQIEAFVSSAPAWHDETTSAVRAQMGSVP